MILLSQQISRRINFKDLFSYKSIPISILNQVSKSNLNIFCKKLLNISKDNKLDSIKENQYILQFGLNRNRLLNYFIDKLYNSQKNTHQIINSYNLNSNGSDILFRYIKLNYYSLKKMAPACVLQNIKSTLPGNFISSNDRNLEESSSNRNQTLNNNINNSNNNNNNHDNKEAISDSNNLDNNTNSNTNTYKDTNNKDNQDKDENNTPLSGLNPVLSSRLNKRDSDMDDKSSNDSSMNEPYSSDEMETRLSRFWYYPSSPLVSPSRFPDNNKDNNDKLKFMNFKSFKVMTFNTLAQSLVDYKYLDNDQSTMSWCKRRNEILKVVQESNSDVVCLQELDELDYINFFKDKFEKLGYECVYKRKLQNRLDGILTMFKKDRYELIMKNELNFSCDYEEYDKPQVALIVAIRDMYSNRDKDSRYNSNNNTYKDTNNKDNKNNNTLENRGDNKEKKTNDTNNQDKDTTNRDNVHKPLEDVLLVTNTHLIFNKSRGDIKLYQLLRLLSGVKETKESVVKYLKENSTSRDSNENSKDNTLDHYQQEYLTPNVLICGDFNITPQSLIYNLLFKGFAPLKNSNPRCLSGQYLMFDQTYLTSSSGHNESGETLGSIKHYMGDVYSEYLQFAKDYSSDSTVVSSMKSYTPSLEVHSNPPGFTGNKVDSNNNTYKDTNNQDKDTTNRDSNNKEKHDNSLVSRIKALDVTQDIYTFNQFSSDWYNEVFKQVDKEDFMVKPEFVEQKDVDEFLELIKGYSEGKGGDSNSCESDELVKQFRSKLNLGHNSNNNTYKDTNNQDKDTNNRDSNNKEKHDNLFGLDETNVIYCPFKLKSAYSADDGFNCEPAFTAYHGWQRGCVDYICYSPDHTLLEGIYEMPLYRKVKENGDLPHKKCPASDHFSLVSQFRRFK